MVKFKVLVQLGLLVLFAGACNSSDATLTATREVSPPQVSSDVQTRTPQDTQQADAPQTPSPDPPSPTPEILAARVNGIRISQEEYQSELALYQDAVDRDLTPKDEERVLNDLINRVLLAQAAAEEGLVVDEATLEDRLEQLKTNIGGSQALSDWMEAYGYDEDSFHLALERSITSARMRDKIITSIPETAEQVHARQILLLSAQEANEVLIQLQAGDDFDNLAFEYDPITRGDLGWFPRGYLPDPQLDEAAFSLEINEYSPVIETPAGFHILVVVERDPQRSLEPDALLMLQIQALGEWLAERRSDSDIEILAP
ncbi:MAG: peptidylprolyl isomerase [Anaerolineales bacterium]